MALSLDELQAVTTDYFLPGKQDIYYKGNLLMYELLREGATYDGGEKIRQILSYGGPHGGAFGKSDTFDTTKYEDHNAARFDPARYYEPVTYDIDDEIVNSGTPAHVDVVLSKLENAQLAIRDTMADGLYGDGTSASGKKVITGLRAMINSTTSTAYGSLTQADLAEWKPGVVTTTTEALSLPVVRALVSACQVGNNDFPNLLLTTPAIFNTFKGLLQPQQRFENPETAKVGFKNIEFEGAVVSSDMKCPAGYLFALNKKYLGMKTHTNFNFLVEKWAKVLNFRKFTTQILWVGNLTCKRRDAHGLHSNLS